MSQPQARLVCDARASIGESPVFADGALLWTDPVRRLLLRIADGADGAPAESATTEQIFALARRAGGPLFGAQEKRFVALSDGAASILGPEAALAPGCRFNDMTVDASGGLWVGAMHRGLLATTGAIFHAPSIGNAPRLVASGLGVPNGMGFSADGATLYLIDTLARTLLAYPVLGGTLDEPSIVSDFLDQPGKPDGMAIGPDGSFWIAMWGGGAVAQLAPDGAFLRRIAIPAPHVSSLCFAAPDRLLVTTSRMRLSPQALADFPASGGVFEIRL